MNDISRYTFSERLPEEFPSQIVVDVTERCNLSCAHCSHSEFISHPKYSACDMQESIHDKLIEEAATDGKGYLRYLRYTAMGEPLLHPLIYTFLSKAKLRSGTTVTFTTNGTLLGDREAQLLLATGVDIVDISLDAFSAQTYSAVRRGGNRETAYKNVLRFLEMRTKNKSHTKIVTTFIDQPLNHGEVEAFRDYWIENGADDVVIRRLHSQGGGKPEIAQGLRLAQQGKERRPCLYPWERLSVGPTGAIGFCPANWNFQSEFATLATTTIREAWQGAYMKSLRRDHLTNCFGDNQCRDCPDWAQTRWPHEGRGYADMVADFMNARGDRPQDAQSRE